MRFKAWAKDAAVRAVKTAAQAALGLLVVDQAGVVRMDAEAMGWAALAAAVISLLQNLANLQVGPDPVLAIDRDAPLLALEPGDA